MASAISVPVNAIIQTLKIDRVPWPASVERNRTKMFPLIIEPISAIG